MWQGAGCKVTLDPRVTHYRGPQKVGMPGGSRMHAQHWLPCILTQRGSCSGL